eukprot:scaffold80160_cov19-Tisochrysis_lutea.AAC.1
MPGADGCAKTLAAGMPVYKIPLHYSEYGLGGGMSMDGSTPAVTAAQAASKPFFGMYPQIYEPGKDPWRQPQVKNSKGLPHTGRMQRRGARDQINVHR